MGAGRASFKMRSKRRMIPTPLVTSQSVAKTELEVRNNSLDGVV